MVKKRAKNKIKLLPCPFCGSSEIGFGENIQRVDCVDFTRRYIECKKCYARTGQVQGGLEENQNTMLIKAWNTRVESVHISANQNEI